MEMFGALCFVCIAVQVSCWTEAGERSARSAIFNANYDRIVRPNETTEVKIGLNLISVNDVNMAGQSMSVTGWLTIEWEDYRLAWDSTTHDASVTFGMDEEIWKPHLFVDNELTDVSVLQDEHLLFRITKAGKVDWEFPKVFTTTCAIDITYYPFDTQACKIEVTSWAYTKEELVLNHLSTGVNDEDLSVNGEWIYLGSKIDTRELVETTSDGYTEKYSMLDFIVVLERRPGFYISNIVLPVVLTSFLLIIVFILPAESGEKIGYSLTVLLAQAVFLTIIADSMPNTSIHVSVLSCYLAFTLVMGVLCVGCSVFVLKIHAQDPEKPVSRTWRKIVEKLMKISCWNGLCESTKVDCEQYAVEQVKDENIVPNEKSKPKIAYELPKFTWKEIADIMDWFFFVYFFVLLCAATIIFVTAMAGGGNINAEEHINGIVQPQSS